MPTIDEMEYGFDAAGVSAYLNEIKGYVLNEACEHVRDTSEIARVCDAEWEGKAKDNFKMNLRLDAVKVAAQYEALYGVLVGEINMLMVSMNSKDKTLIENDFSL